MDGRCADTDRRGQPHTVDRVSALPRHLRSEQTETGAARQLGWHDRSHSPQKPYLDLAFQARLVSTQVIPLSTRGSALFHNVKLDKKQWYGPVHVIFGRNNLNGEFWAVVSDEPTTLQTLAEYGLRFDIEESFLDDQSSGWNR